MSKRNRISNDHDETLLTEERSDIYIPDVHVNYGGYGKKRNDDQMNKIMNTSIDEVDDYNDDNNYVENIEINDMNHNSFELEEEITEFYEEPNFENIVFNDNILFENGVVISKDNNSNVFEDEVNAPLFEGSLFSLKQFCRYMLILKSNLNLGAVSFTLIVGSIISFLPVRNGLLKYVNENPSLYDINKTVDKLSYVNDCCRVFKFLVCDEGKCILSNQLGAESIKSCIHPKLNKTTFHYLPVRDRIWKLLHSDARNFLHSYDYMNCPDNYEEVNYIILKQHHIT
jgi:hypothetical protein